jgi:glutamate-5-semialdehyde dehydrogenase
MSALELIRIAKSAATGISLATIETRNAVLRELASSLRLRSTEILTANGLDLQAAVSGGMELGLQDRLRLDEKRIESLARAVEEIIQLDDPLGETVMAKTLPNGIQIRQVRVPFGLIGMIYEARPNVTIDIAALAIKSGNALVLRGGSAAQKTNGALIKLIGAALASAQLDANSIQTVDAFGRDGALAIMHARGLVDVLIPRGSAGLIKTVVEESKVPVIETGDGVVHIFVDSSADLEKAIPIIINSKVQRPSVCNSLETLLVHSDVAAELLPKLATQLSAAGVVLHACAASLALMPGSVAATEKDWSTEYLSLELSVRVVDSLDQALEHIAKYSTRHTESILTRDAVNASRFQAEVDSAVVMVNTSTRFTDGGEFGFGAEVGVSTQKLHARGPMGLTVLTSTKWLVTGDGQVRS